MLLRPVNVDDLRIVVGDGMVSLSGRSGPVLDVVADDVTAVAERLREFADEIDAAEDDDDAILRWIARSPRLVSAGALSAGMRVLPDAPASGLIHHENDSSSWVTVLSVVKCGRAVEVATDAPSRSVRLWDAELSVWALPAVEGERGAA